MIELFGKNVNRINGWIARSEAGFLYFFKQKPDRVKPIDDYGYWDAKIYDTPLELPFTSFKIDWEDEPREAEIIIRLK